MKTKFDIYNTNTPAKWIRKELGMGYAYKCSKCNKYNYDSTPYCPYCGIKIKKIEVD